MSQPIRVLALDTATKTGWACRTITSEICSGVKEFPLRRGSSPGARFLEFRLWLKRLIEATEPEIVVYELAHHRGGATTELCVGFTTRVMEEAAAVGIEYRGCHSQTLKVFATGSGNADKGAMVAAARERFPLVDVQDDNHADAILLMAWGEAGFPDTVAERKAREVAARAEAEREREGIRFLKAVEKERVRRERQEAREQAKREREAARAARKAVGR